MTEETTEQFLARRENELTNRLNALRGQLIPLETELAKVRRMRTLLGGEEPQVSALAKVFAAAPTYSLPNSNPIDTQGSAETAYASRTIKDLAIQALIDGFPNGATATELREFMRTGYFRTVDPGSLRTQLHRLKAAGVLGQEQSNDTWNFRDGQRALYLRFNHPSSRKNDVKLQDDPTESDFSDSPILDAAAKMPWDEGKK